MSPAALTRHRETGIALIAVLILLVFILTIVGGLFYRHQIHIQKTTRSLLGEQALLLALGAESWAKTLLARDARESGNDNLTEAWARGLPPLPVEGGTLSGCLVDMQGRFAINSLGSYSIKGWEDEQKADLESGDVTTPRRILRRLLAELELDDSDARLAALVDWLDPDAWLLTPESAEDNEYLLRTPAYRAGNQAFAEIGELSLVQGFSAVDVMKLAPWVNVIGETVAVNVNTASLPVLVALSPHITPEVAQRLLEVRPFDSLDAFYTALADAAGVDRQVLQAALPQQFVSVDTRYFSLQARVELGGVSMAYTSLLRRDSGDQIAVLDRTLRYIPAITTDDGRQVVAASPCQSPEEVQSQP